AAELAEERHRDPVVEPEHAVVDEAEECQEVRPVVAPGDRQRAVVRGDHEGRDDGDDEEQAVAREPRTAGFGRDRGDRCGARSAGGQRTSPVNGVPRIPPFVSKTTGAWAAIVAGSNSGWSTSTIARSQSASAVGPNSTSSHGGTTVAAGHTQGAGAPPSAPTAPRRS